MKRTVITSDYVSNLVDVVPGLRRNSIRPTVAFELAEGSRPGEVGLHSDLLHHSVGALVLSPGDKVAVEITVGKPPGTPHKVEIVRLEDG